MFNLHLQFAKRKKYRLHKKALATIFLLRKTAARRFEGNFTQNSENMEQENRSRERVRLSRRRPRLYLRLLLEQDGPQGVKAYKFWRSKKRKRSAKKPERSLWVLPLPQFQNVPLKMPKSNPSVPDQTVRPGTEEVLANKMVFLLVFDSSDG